MRRPCRQRGLEAFTLIELVISIALGAVILVSAYACLNSALASQKIIEPRVDLLQNARVAMSMIATDLRSACPLSKESDFLGVHRSIGEVEADNLDFGTHNFMPTHDREGDFCQVSYFLDRDLKTGEFILWRRRNPFLALDPLSGGKRERIASGLKGLRLEYYDGFDWYDTWGQMKGKGNAEAKAQSSNRIQPNMTGMPEAVKITIWLDANPNRKPVKPDEEPEVNPEKPFMFQTIARLNLSKGSPNAGVSDSSDGSAQGGQNGGQ
ncbi:MAG: hypothetical protein JWM04_2745 [Verrucomicrobiales bacterium]|nr:hypothetical protein [Verrucomicrobiales bacterium]